MRAVIKTWYGLVLGITFGCIVAAIIARGGVHGQAVGTATVTGPMPGVMFMYDSTGAPMTSYSCAFLTGTTSGGTFSLSGTAPNYAGVNMWTTPANAWVEDVRVTSAGTSNINQAYIPFPVTLTASATAVSLSGVVLSPTTLVVLGATAINAGTNKSISAKVCAN